MGFITPGLALGGAEIWLVALLEHLAGDRIQIAGTAMLQNTDEPFLWDRAAACGDVFMGANALTQLAAQSDVLIAWGFAGAWGKLSQFPGRLIMVSHGSGPWSEELLKDCPDHVELVAVSQAAARVAGRDDVTVIHNGIDPNRCQPKRSREQVRESWGVGPGEIIVGYVGRFGWDKGLSPLAAAIASLGRGYRGLFIGTQQQNKGQTAGPQSLCPDLIIRPPVENVGDIYAALDCYALPSVTEGFSMALVEAWYCGVPVVATRVGAVPELEAVHGQLVVPVPVHPRVQELTRAIKKAIDPANRPVIERAAAAARQHWTADVMASRWTEYLCR